MPKHASLSGTVAGGVAADGPNTLRKRVAFEWHRKRDGTTNNPTDLLHYQLTFAKGLLSPGRLLWSQFHPLSSSDNQRRGSRGVEFIRPRTWVSGLPVIGARRSNKFDPTGPPAAVGASVASSIG